MAPPGGVRPAGHVAVRSHASLSVGVIRARPSHWAPDRDALPLAAIYFSGVITMPSSYSAVRGAVFDLIDDPWKPVGNEQASARFLRDGMLVTDSGRIVDFGPFA